MKNSSFEENRSLNTAIEIYDQRIKDAQEIYQKYKANFIERNCPICSSPLKINQEDFHQTYKIVKCKVCNSTYVDPAPNLDAIEDYYKNGKCNRMLAELTRNRSKKFNVDDRIETINKIIEQSEKQELKILEVGCSSGLFLQGLKDHLRTHFPKTQFSLYGIDLDRDAINKSVDPSLNLLCYSAESLCNRTREAGTYDLVLHYELIEHLLDPYKFMMTVKKLLKPGGCAVFTTPNALGVENLACGYNSRRLIAHAIFPPMHLNAFSVQNISLFSYRLGFEIVEISTPGKLDIDMISKNKEFLTNDSFTEIAELEDEMIKQMLQKYTANCMVSSHMQCILRKPL